MKSDYMILPDDYNSAGNCIQFLDNSDRLALSRVSKSYYTISVYHTYRIQTLEALEYAIGNNMLFDMNYSALPASNLTQCLHYSIKFNVAEIYKKIMDANYKIRYEHGLYYACMYHNENAVAYFRKCGYTFDKHRTLMSLAKYGNEAMADVIISMLRGDCSPMYISHAGTYHNYDVALAMYTRVKYLDTHPNNTYLGCLFRDGKLEHIVKAAPYIQRMEVYLGSAIAGGHINVLKYILDVTGIRLCSSKVAWGLICACTRKHYDMIEFILRRVILDHKDMRYIRKIIGDSDQRISFLFTRYQ